VVSWEATFPSISVFQAGFQPDCVISAVWAREAFSIASEVPQSADIFCS
jgi:hypothetical protein